MNLQSWFDPLRRLIDEQNIPSAEFPSVPPPRTSVGSASPVNLGGKAISITLDDAVNNRDDYGFFINPRTGEREPVYLHSSLNATESDYEALPKWHMLYCSTLETFYREGKINNYAIKNDDKNDQFVITSAHNGKAYIRSLRACKHCLRQLHMKDHVFRDVRSFTYAHFKTEFGNTAPPERLGTLIPYDEAEKNFYPPDWPAISARRKQEEGYRCQDCESPFDLQVHHVNEKKNDNSTINLRVLCVNCHQKYHKHRIAGLISLK